MTKPIIATVSLAGCFGCHMSLLDIDERLFDLVELVELHKSPFTDIKNFEKKCDLGLIEGGCCNSENVEVLRTFRKNCDILISIGECATMGGLPSLRNSIPIKDCLEEAYLRSVSVDEADQLIPGDEDLPILLDKVYPCHEIVKIDALWPGCPPPAEMIWEALLALIKGQPLELDDRLFKYD